MRNWHLQGHILSPNSGVKVNKTNLWVNNGIIGYVPDKISSFKKAHGYVLPGLVDAHCHLGMSSRGATSIAVAQKQAVLNMKKGTLVIRDGGSKADNTWFKARTDMPVVMTAGTHIAKTKRYIKGYGVELENEHELVREVHVQASNNSWVKIVADWIDRSLGQDSDIMPLWSPSVLKEAIDVAHDLGAKVMAHAFGRQAAEDLVECGVDSIEHGTGLDKNHAQDCATKGIAVVPTMLQRENFILFAQQGEGKYPRYAETMRSLYESRFEQLLMLFENNVLLLPGTDAGGHVSHGMLPDELALWVKAGIPVADVVDFATFRARQYFGLSCLEEYANADLVVYDSDPREDISVLRTPKLVLLRGRKV